MTMNPAATRRAVLQAGALLAMPLAAPAATGAGAATAESAIRALHRDWLDSINRAEGRTPAFLLAGEADIAAVEAIRAVVPDPAEGAGTITIAADGASALARYPSIIAIATRRPRGAAAAPANVPLRRSERGTIAVSYRKSGAIWAIETIAFAPA